MDATIITLALTCDEDLTLNYTVNEESALTILYTDEDSIIVPIFMSVVMAFGLLTNLAFLLVVLHVHHMQTATNHYLVQMALADMVYLVFGAGAKVLYFAASPVTFDKQVTGAAGCTLIPFFSSVSYFASLFFMTLVTREKFLAVCKPLKHRGLSGRHRTIRLTLAAWGIAVLISSTLIPSSCTFTPLCIQWPVAWNQTGLPDVTVTCMSISEWMVSYSSSVQTIPFFLTMSLTLSMCIAIIRSPHFRVAPARDRQRIGPATTRKIRSRNQVTRMLVVNGVVFFSLLAPFECCSIASWIRILVTHPLLGDDQFHLCTQIVRTLAYMQSAINPIVYYVVHPRYRSAFIETFIRRKKGLRSDLNKTEEVHTIRTLDCVSP